MAREGTRSMRDSSPVVDGDHEATEGDQQPLLGVILCCTSIPPEQRDHLADAAKEMGAVTKLDLTSDVTHLIVGDVDTAKYKYVARERRDIKVLSVSWLEAVRSAWLAGGQIDLETFDEQHRLPALFNLRICMTGFEEMELRNDLSAKIQANGAEYHGDLTRAVTHLIAAAPKGKKYEYAGQWGIRIVAVEWLHQSLGRGMVLDEKLFHPLMPLEERGLGAVRHSSPPSAKRKADALEKTKDAQRRKLRRTASTKLESQNDTLWADIGSGDARPASAPDGEWQDHAPPAKLETESDAMVPSKWHASTKPGAQQKMPRARGEISPSAPEGPFKGERICIHGFAQAKVDILLGHLVAGGAQIISWDQLLDLKTSDRDMLPTTVLLPHDVDSAILNRVKGEMPRRCTIASEWWVEKCIFDKAPMPKDSVLCQPFQSSRIEGFSNVIVCPTSFAGMDLLHFSKAMKLMGAEYDETLTSKTSVLVCGTSRHPKVDKLRYAMAYGIPIVTAEWAWSCVRNNRIEGLDKYMLGGQKKVKPLPLPGSSRRQSTSKGPVATTKDAQSSKPPSQPLREITPHANSQSRSQASQASDADESLESALRTSGKQKARAGTDVDENAPSPVGVAGQLGSEREQTEERVKEAIEQLQRQKQEASGTRSEVPGRRRHRQLGRAQSNPSSLATRSDSVNERQSIVPTADEEEDELGAAGKQVRQESGFRPSQMLTYESEESAAAREQLMKRGGGDMGMDGALDQAGHGEKARRVESIGVARDGTRYEGGVRKTTRRRG